MSDCMHEGVRPNQMKSSENQKAFVSLTRNEAKHQTQLLKTTLSRPSLPRARRFAQGPREAICRYMPARMSVWADPQRCVSANCQALNEA